MDLRYLVPPLISLLILLCQHKDNLWPQSHLNLAFGILYHLHDHPFSLFILAMFVFLFPFISVNLPITLQPIHLEANFSALLTVSMVASFIFPASLFYLIFPILIIASPRYRMLSDGFKRFIYCFYNILQRIPTLVIHCTIQNHGESEAAAPDGPQAEIEQIQIVLADE